jgi:hypothetical protein
MSTGFFSWILLSADLSCPSYIRDGPKAHVQLQHYCAQENRATATATAPGPTSTIICTPQITGRYGVIGITHSDKSCQQDRPLSLLDHT